MTPADHEAAPSQPRLEDKINLVHDLGQVVFEEPASHPSRGRRCASFLKQQPSQRAKVIENPATPIYVLFELR